MISQHFDIGNFKLERRFGFSGRANAVSFLLQAMTTLAAQSPSPTSA
jgi:hypothetical protein